MRSVSYGNNFAVPKQPRLSFNTHINIRSNCHRDSPYLSKPIAHNVYIPYSFCCVLVPTCSRFYFCSNDHPHSLSLSLSIFLCRSHLLSSALSNSYSSKSCSERKPTSTHLHKYIAIFNATKYIAVHYISIRSVLCSFSQNISCLAYVYVN